MLSASRLSLVLILSVLSQTVMANLVAPTLSVPATSDTGKFEISFNGPANVPNNHDYRLYESIDGGTTWEFITSASKAFGDLPPFTKTLKKSHSGTYKYKANVCVVDTHSCSTDSTVSTTVVDLSNIIVDDYALEFDGVDDYVSFLQHDIHVLYEKADINFQWTYQGPGKNYVLSGVHKVSTNTQDHLYITESGLGFNIKGVDQQWDFDATGTHTYLLRKDESGVFTLFVDGVSIGEKTFSTPYPINHFRYMGKYKGEYSRGRIHYLNIDYPHVASSNGSSTSVDGWFYSFEDNSYVIKDSKYQGGNATFSPTGEENWIRLISLPPGTPVTPILKARSSYTDTFSLAFEPSVISDDYEYRLYESDESGNIWNHISTVSNFSIDTEPFVKSLTKQSDLKYHYKAKQCIRNTTQCSNFSNTEIVSAFAPVILTVPDFNDTGSFDITFNAPEDVPDNSEYRLYESINGGATWYFLTSASKAFGDLPPFTKTLKKSQSGTYKYKSNVCVIDTQSCSKDSTISTTAVDLSNIVVDDYALEFDGIDDYLSFMQHEITIAGEADINFKWTYQGPGKNYILSGIYNVSRNTQDYIYLAADGLGFSLNGIDEQWDFDATGTHTYLLRSNNNDGSFTLFVDGVSLGDKTVSKPNPINRFRDMGKLKDEYSRGRIHYLNINHRHVLSIDNNYIHLDGWFFSFENDGNQFRDLKYSAGSAGFSPSGDDSWVRLTPEEPTIPVSPVLTSYSGGGNTFSLSFSPKEIPDDHEYRLYESNDFGSAWQLVSVINKSSGYVFPYIKYLIKPDNTPYQYKAKQCIHNTNLCSGYSNIRTVSANAYLIEPVLSAPEVSNEVGSYQVDFNAPLNVASDYEYRLYESSDNKQSWTLVDTKSIENGDILPFIYEAKNKPNNQYYYKAEVCQDGNCSLESNVIKVISSSLPLMEDNYALEFDGIDDYVQVPYGREISMLNYGDLEFKWTYQGPEKNYVLSGIKHSTTNTQPHLYVSQTGIGLNLQGVDYQWDYDTSGTHTYLLRINADWSATLYINGELIGTKSFPQSQYINRFKKIGRIDDQFGRGIIHWLRIDHRYRKEVSQYNYEYYDGWYYKFDDKTNKIQSAWDNSYATLYSSDSDSWVDGDGVTAEYLYPPVINSPDIRHLKTNIETYKFNIPLNKKIRTNYEFVLHESNDEGESWSVALKHIPNGDELYQYRLLQLALTGREDEKYQYKANICLENTTYCSEFTDVDHVINTEYLIPRAPEVYSPAIKDVTTTKPCFEWEDLGSNVTYTLAVSTDMRPYDPAEGNFFFDTRYVIDGVEDNSICWSNNWSSYKPNEEGHLKKVSDTSPASLGLSEIYYLHVWAYNTEAGYNSENKLPNLYFFTDMVRPQLSVSHKISDGERYEVLFNEPEDVPDNHEYRIYESTDYGETWEYSGYISRQVGGVYPFKNIYKDKPVGEYQYRAKVCMMHGTNASVCSGYSDVVSVNVIPKIPAPTLTADRYATSSEGIHFNHNAPANVPDDYRYYLHESADGGVTWTNVGYLNKYVFNSGLEPFNLLLKNREEGQYLYKSQICRYNPGASECPDNSDESDCTICSHFSEVIEVTVADNFPPAVSILSPADNYQAIIDAPIILKASAHDRDNDGIDYVEFWINDQLHQTVDAEPYEITIPSVPEGTHTWYVRAVDHGDAEEVTPVHTVTATQTVAYPPLHAHSLPPAGKPYVDPTSSDGIGATAGQFRVNESGAATYNIPIAAPAGVAGVTPEMSLTYSSHSGNGLVGLGWSMGGLSAISRCRQTLGQDGESKPITWTSDDRLCLDGQRLILESGMYGDDLTTYRTEIDSYVRVKAHGSMNSANSYFSVSRKDGSVVYYGKTADSKQTFDSDKTLTWMQNRFEDSVGNGIDYSYESEGGHRLSRVDYAGGDAAIIFHYGDGRDDIQRAYVAGYEMVTSKLLNRVEVKNNNQEVRTYTLRYAPLDSALNRESRLVGIRESVGSSLLPETTFDWNLFQGGFDTTKTGAITFSYESDEFVSDYTPADINGDGRMDFVWQQVDKEKEDKYVEHQHYYYVLSKYDEVNEKYTYTENQYVVDITGNQSRKVASKFYMIDYNADGRSDLAVYKYDEGWRIYLSQPDSDNTWKINGSQTPVELPFSEDTRFFDINSDGLIDAVNATGYRLLEPDPNALLTSNTPFHFSEEQPLTIEGLLPWDNSHINNIEDGYDHATYIGSELGDFNGDGRVDMVIYDLEERWEKFSSPGPAPIWRYRIVDIGVRAYLAHFENNKLVVQHKLLDFNQTSGFDNLDIELKSTARANFLDRHSRLYQKLHIADLNGDGLSDLVIQRDVDNAVDIQGGHIGDQHYAYRFSTVTGFTEEQEIGTFGERTNLQFVDYNYDGATDIVWNESDKLYAQPWYNGSPEAPILIKNIGSEEKRNHFIVDMSGDGRLDYVTIFETEMNTTYANNDGTPLNVVTAIHNGFGATTDISYGTLANSGHYARRDFSINAQELCFTNETNNEFLSAGEWCGEFEMADTNAFYEALNSDWDYTDLAPANTEQQSLGKYQPVFDFMAPIQVVTQVDSTAPTFDGSTFKDDDTSSVSYFYGQARMQAAGRGLLGFYSLRTQDNQSGVKTTTYYRQDFPFIGSPQATIAWSKEGYKLSEARNHWEVKGWGSTVTPELAKSGTAQMGSLRPYLKQAVEYTYDLVENGQYEGFVLQTVTTTNTYDNHGNIEEIIVKTEGSNSLDVFTQTTTNDYGSESNSIAFSNSDHTLLTFPELGRLIGSSVKAERTGQSAHTRNATFAYYLSDGEAGPKGEIGYAGLLKSETVIAENTANNLTTSYGYDTFGNKVSSTQVGNEIAALPNETPYARTRKTTQVYSSDGRYLDKTINTYGQTTQRVISRNGLGLPTAVEDINGNRTEMTYSAFGHKLLTYSANGAYEKTQLSNAGTQCTSASGAVYQSMTTRAGGGANIECFDVLGRSVRTATLLLQGNWSMTDTQYDSSGRVLRKSEPHDGKSKIYWTTLSYDILDRVVETTLPNGSTASVKYEGFKVTTTNPLGQKKEETKNARGEVVHVLDNDGGTLDYTYDAQGNLRTVTRNGIEATKIVMGYDDFGRKISMVDPDKGSWTYQYNSFGELRLQTDAKQQLSAISYDDLGRMINRIDRTAGGSDEHNATWAYNNSTSRSGDVPAGALISEYDSSTGYRKDYRYDSLGRPDITVTTLASNDSHYERVTYDEYGRTYQLFDAAMNKLTGTDGDIAWHSGIQHHYNSQGYLTLVTDLITVDDQPKHRYYEAQAMDARGNIVKFTNSSGVTTVKDFNAATGHINNIYSDTNTSLDPIQNLTYDWDAVGNLNWRKDYSADKNVEDHFGYDGLNRLLTVRATEGGSVRQSITYDEQGLGNIKTKTHHQGELSETTTYGYDLGNNPYRLLSTDAGDNFAYDYNGNIKSDGHRDIVYNTFDKPISINKGQGAHITTFKYGTQRGRYLRSDQYPDGRSKTTKYLGNVEKISYSDGKQEIKRYLPGGAVITITHTEVNNLTVTEEALTFIHKDHLGSVDVITNSQGQIIEQLSFDAWGQRRDPQIWADLDVTELLNFDNSLTTRGYTGHEMLDEVGLIHMNGRIYDARLARFMQADPFVQAPSDLQMYNRYAYVRNNPLNATDPSGFILDSIVMSRVDAEINRPLFKEINKHPGLAQMIQIIGTAVATYYCGPCSIGFNAQFSKNVAFSQTGSFGTAMRSAAISAASSAVFYGIGQANFSNQGLQVFAHGMAGGIMAELQGGKFAHGFMSAGFTKAATVSGIVGGGMIEGSIKAALVGGTISAMTGGKFANGALTGAFSYLLNECLSTGCGDLWGEVYNQKAVRGTTERKEPVGDIYEGIYDEGEWSADYADQMHASDALPGKKIIKAFQALSTKYTQKRVVVYGDMQVFETYEYETLYDLSNGQRVNERIIWNTEKFISREVIKLETNIRSVSESRDCYVIVGGC